MKIIFAAFLILLSGCVTHNSKLVDELESWNGKSETWVIKRLGPALSQNQLRQPIPDIGEFQGVQQRILKECPEYSGEVRRMSWKKEDVIFLVFLINHE